MVNYVEIKDLTEATSTYADLFAAIGTTFGAGDGSTTFGLPDLRGEFIRGHDNNRGVDSGRTFGSSQGDEIKSHTHRFSGSTTQGGLAGPDVDNSYASSLNLDWHTDATGGTETRPRNVALMACIKY